MTTRLVGRLRSGLLLAALFEVAFASSLAHAQAPVPYGAPFAAPFGMRFDSANNLYVANIGNWTVTKTSPGGSPTVVVTSGTISMPIDVAFDSTGNLFIASDGGNVYKMASATGAPVLFSPWTGESIALACDAANNVYIGSYTHGVVRKVPPSGGTGTVFASGLPRIWGVACDASNNVYVSYQASGPGTSGVVKITPSGTQTNLGSGWSFPARIALAPNGDLYVADRGSNLVSKITPAGAMSTVTSFSNAGGMAFDTTGNLYIASLSGQAYFVTSAAPPTPPVITTPGSSLLATSGNALHQTITATGVPAPTFSATGLPSGLSINSTSGVISGTTTAVGNHSVSATATNSNGSGSKSFTLTVGTVQAYATGLVYPYAMAFDSAGTLYVGGGNNDIVKISSTGAVTPFATGVNNPDAAAFDSAGNLFVTNYGNGTISKITPAGVVSTFASGFSQPRGAAFDSGGNFYTASSNTGAIYRVTSAGAVSTFVSGVSNPINLAFDASGNLWFTQWGGVSRVSPTGVVTQVAASAGQTDGIVIDSFGNAIVIDFGGTVQRVSPAGVVTTLAGGFNQPRGIAMDSTGAVYVGNTAVFNNNTVSRIGVPPPVVTGVFADTGAFRAGASVPIRVNFSQAVTVTGTPTLTLETGAIDQVVNYSSGGGGASGTIFFNYVVQPGNTSADLNYISSSALALNGGTIRSSTTGVTASLTLPAPGATGSLGATSNVVIDTTAPRLVSIVRQSPTTATTNADSLTFRLAFDEAVTGVDVADFIVVGTTATASVAKINATTFDVTVAGGDLPALNGTVILAFASGFTIEDLAGNALTNTSGNPLDNRFFVVNNSAPSHLALAPSAINQSAAIAGATIGTLTSTDPDAGDSATYSLVAGAGSTHNGSFTIAGATLRIGGAALGAGSYSVRVRTTDSGGLFFEQAFGLTVVDNIAPLLSLPASPVVAEATGPTGAAVSFTVSALDSTDGSLTPTVSRASGSTFALGDTTVNVSATDSAGNTATGSFIVTVSDTLAPDTTITSTPPNLTNSPSATFAFAGTDAGSGIALFQVKLDGGAFTPATGSAHTFSGLSDGPHTFQVRAIDAAGNADPTPASHTWSIDTVAPAAPVVTGISNDTGSSATDGITSDTTLVINGTAEALSTVEVFKGGASIGQATAGGGGAWSFDYTGTVLAAGDHAFTARATDAAGNTGATSAAFIATLDLDVPAPIIVGISTDSGSSGADGITNDTTLLLAGTAEPHSTVTITRSGAGIIGTALAGANGVWSFDSSGTTLADGSYLFTARATDRAGNTSAASADFPVVIDTVAPVIAEASITGTYKSALTHAMGGSGAPASYTATGLPPGLTLNATTGEISGAATQSGTFTVALTATDLAGNTGSGALTVTINKVNLTVAGAVAADKDYDGNASAALSFAGASLVGVVSGDAVTLITSGAAGTFASVNVGPAQAVTVTGLALAGADSPHYTLTAPVPSARITPRPLAIAADAKTKVYGTSDPALTFTLKSGSLVAGEALSGALVRAAGENVGSYAITQGTLTAGANYTIVFTPATLGITPATPTISVSGYTGTYDGNPHGATGSAAGVGGANLSSLLNLGASFTHAPGGTAHWSFHDAAGNYHDASGSVPIAIARATPTISVSGYAITYDGNPHTATGSARGVNGESLAGLDLSGTTHTNAGSYADVWTFTDATGNYQNASGNVSDSILQAAPTIVVTPYNVSYDTVAHTATGSAKGVKGESLTGLNLAGTTHTNAGTYADTWSFSDVTGNHLSATGSVTNRIGQAPVTLEFDELVQPYNGTARAVIVTTSPANIPVSITYNGSAAAPKLPGSYTVIATVTNANYTGSLTDTLLVTVTSLVRHAPTFNGEIEGSLQVLLPESATLNGSAMISGDLLMPGTPSVRLNGKPTFGGTIDSSGDANPTSHQVTLNGNAVLGHLVRRVNALRMPTVDAPPAPASTRTRTVILNRATDPIGDWTTVRNLTLNGNGIALTIPEGTYGNIVANGNSTLTLGVAGAATRAVYNLQNLTLNGNTVLRVVGPVTLTLANGVSLNGDVGDAGHPERLILRVASGHVTLQGNVDFAGDIIVPDGTLTLNGNTTLKGHITSDRLVLNGNSVLTDPELP